ncbi:MAG: threonine synthase [Chitinispirillia bacterium]|jgi:threonine synthase
MVKPIQYYSTNLKAEPVSFSEALLKGLAPDKGLFMPESIPTLSSKEILAFSDMDYYEIAHTIISKFIGGQVADDNLMSISKDAYNFPVPLEKVLDNKYILRLDQGPTASFKDFAARMMGRLMQYFIRIRKRELLILTATSGDTGSAIANAFYGLDNIRVVVLFPRYEVTERQRMQMTTLGKNIESISIDGKFDDCQALVKRAFSDPDLDYLNLSSANSINIGRLVPQIVYYFYSFVKLRKGTPDDTVIISIPSGNFGNMMGGLIAKKMGLPVKKFIIVTNENDEFTVYMKTGNYSRIEPSRNCLSNAMNIGHPSNLARVVALYGGVMDEKGTVNKPPDMEAMRNDMYAVSINDSETKTMMINAFRDYKLILEPHGAVGWAGLQKYLSENREDSGPDKLCISIETAHPSKFPEAIRETLGFDPDLSKSLEGIEGKSESYVKLKNNYSEFKDFLKKAYS